MLINDRYCYLGGVVEHEEMLTVRQVADVLNIGFSSARRLVTGDTPEIPSQKIGRLRRVRRTILDAYIRAGSNVQPDTCPTCGQQRPTQDGPA